METAYENLVATLHFRKEHKDLFKAAQETPVLKFYIPGCAGGFIGDQLILLTFFGQTDMNELAKQHGGLDEAVKAGLFATEQVRHLLDKRTRETGRLNKLISVVDLQGMSLGKAANRTMMNAMGAVSKSNDINTPQLLSKIVMLNVPSLLHVLMSMMRPLMSKATMDKISMCKRKATKGDITLCPFINSFPDGPANVPKPAGGHFKGV